MIRWSTFPGECRSGWFFITNYCQPLPLEILQRIADAMLAKRWGRGNSIPWIGYAVRNHSRRVVSGTLPDVKPGFPQPIGPAIRHVRTDNPTTAVRGRSDGRWWRTDR